MTETNTVYIMGYPYMHDNKDYVSLSHWGLHSTDPKDYVSYNFMEKYL